MKFISPTGMGIRNDAKGLGHHGSPRGHRTHDGVDLRCKLGQDILMPVDGIITRVSMPYRDDKRWLGAYIVNPRIEIKMWYFVPILLGMELKVGSVIGIAQDIGSKYKGVTPHIHFRICKIDPRLFFPETDEELYEDVLREG
jgi:hypothetical protein